MLWRIEIRKTAPVFLGAGSVSIICEILRLYMKGTQIMDLIFLLSHLVIWALFIGYSFSIVYCYFVLGKDALSHLGNASAAKESSRKTMVLTCWLWIFFMVSLALNIPHLSASFGASVAPILIYYVIAKTVSLAFFFSCLLCSVVLGKNVRQKIISLGISIMFFLIVCTIAGFIDSQLAATSGPIQFMVGVSNGPIASVNTYAGLIPIILEHPDSQSVILPYGSVAINVIFSALCLGLWRILITRKYDFYPR